MCIRRTAHDPIQARIEKPPRCSVRQTAVVSSSCTWAARFARKRIDVLLRVVAALRRRDPRIRLIQVGGPLTASQRRLAAALGLNGHVTETSFVDRRVLAAVYRRAALLLQTSDREGFGLPVAEAMTCGTPVVASDLPALREVGGPAATYCPAGDVERWTAAVERLLDERANDVDAWRRRQAEGTAWAQRFDWRAHARATIDVYRDVLSGASPRLADVHG